MVSRFQAFKAGRAGEREVELIIIQHVQHEHIVADAVAAAAEAKAAELKRAADAEKLAAE